MIDVFDSIKLEIFKFLWLNPNEKHSISEISKESGVSYGATWKALKEFKKKGLVVELIKKAHLYSLNLDSNLCVKSWSLWNALKKNELSKTAGYENYFEAMDYLNEKIPNEFIVLFGSVARKEASKESDLDVLVLSDKKFDKNRISREIQIKYFVEPKITVVSRKELAKFVQEKRPVYQNIWKDGLVWNNEIKFFDLMKKLWVN